MSSVTSFAPGRVELLGNHTDYNEGVVLSAAIELGVTATGRRREDLQIVLTSDGAPGKVVVLRAEPIQRSGGWEDYPLGVAEMLRQAGAEAGGFEMNFTASLPSGAGLSSSAAIEVATALCLCRLYPFPISPMDIARLCRRAENEFVGVSCGLLDQVSSVFGKKDEVVFLDCRTESVSTIPFPPSLSLLIIHSGVKHALTGGEFNERRAQCFEAARIMGVRALRDVTSAELEGAELSDLLRRRARHVVGENERVLEGINFLRAGNGSAFGRLMTASHESSIVNFENSTAELDELVRLAIAQPGCHGARLTGGGFGGAIVALVDKEAISSVQEIILENYAKATGHHAQAYPCIVSNGATVTAF